MRRHKPSKTTKDDSTPNIDKENIQSNTDDTINAHIEHFIRNIEITDSYNTLEEEIEEVPPEAGSFESIQPEDEPPESTQSKYSSSTWFSHIYDLFKFYTDTKRRK